jgi:uncharacterized membrane protein
MKRVPRRQQGKGGLELIEEAVHLLRTAPLGAFSCYYLGSLPFVLGLLYFWADMSRNPFADERLAQASLVLAGLFLWMKTWQAAFARRLRAVISMSPAAKWSFARCRRMVLAQCALQPWGLFLLPLSLVAIVPFAWVYAFFQNLTAQDEGEALSFRALVEKSARQAFLWPAQNHLVLGVLAAFGFLVFLNWTLVCLLLPYLFKMLSGVETVFSRSGLSLLNTTFLTAVFALTYLGVDPVAKAVYVLRCFHGESLRSGDDLKAELKQHTSSPRVLAPAGVVLLGLVLLWPCSSVFAAEGMSAEGQRWEQGQAEPARSQTGIPAPQSAAISPAGLDRAIEDVIQQRKYTWRIPRERVAKPDEADRGVIARFLDNLVMTLRQWARAALEWLGECLRKPFMRQRTTAGGSGYGWITLLQLLLYAAVAVAVIALGFLLFRILQNRRRASTAIQSEAIQPAPDLADENLGADHLPEDGWTKLARELLERGELRLALRAFYLASLAHLAKRNLISLARFKSNRDYERELQRRGHAFGNLLAVFGENVLVFDRIWYGMHEVTMDLVQQFAANVERIKTGG